MGECKKEARTSDRTIQPFFQRDTVFGDMQAPKKMFSSNHRIFFCDSNLNTNMYAILTKLDQIENLLTPRSLHPRYRGKRFNPETNEWVWDGVYDDDSFPIIPKDLLPMIRTLLLTIKQTNVIPFGDFKPFSDKMETDEGFDIFADENIPALLTFCVFQLQKEGMTDDYEFEQRKTAAETAERRKTAAETAAEEEEFMHRMGLH